MVKSPDGTPISSPHQPNQRPESLELETRLFCTPEIFAYVIVTYQNGLAFKQCRFAPSEDLSWHKNYLVLKMLTFFTCRSSGLCQHDVPEFLVTKMTSFCLSIAPCLHRLTGQTHLNLETASFWSPMNLADARGPRPPNRVAWHNQRRLDLQTTNPFAHQADETELLDPLKQHHSSKSEVLELFIVGPEALEPGHDTVLGIRRH